VEGVPVTAQIDMLQTHDLWRLTMEHSPVGMALVSLSGDLVSVNLALCEMLGHPPEVLTGLTFRDITHPDDLSSDVRLVLQALADEISSYRITKRYVRADGQVVIGDLSVALLRAPDGTPIHFIAQIVDLTERDAIAQRLDVAEATIESEQRKADAVFDTVAVGLLLLDANGAYQGYNKRHQDFMDLAFPEGHRGRVGQTGFLFDADQTRLLTSEEMPTTRAVAGEELDDFLLWVGEDPLARRAVSVSARSVRGRHGAFAGAALAYHDVTDLVRASPSTATLRASLNWPAPIPSAPKTSAGAAPAGAGRVETGGDGSAGSAGGGPLAGAREKSVTATTAPTTRSTMVPTIAATPRPRFRDGSPRCRSGVARAPAERCESEPVRAVERRLPQ
jgi:hypothetical protein